ncbi:hypothetical protein, partial [Salmonella enterica]|uniref:hypothetical protein n=1 Tax=Salmonella enterica TaxID=28901 RepID=UPI0020C1F9E7
FFSCAGGFVPGCISFGGRVFFFRFPYLLIFACGASHFLFFVVFTAVLSVAATVYIGKLPAAGLYLWPKHLLRQVPYAAVLLFT